MHRLLRSFLAGALLLPMAAAAANHDTPVPLRGPPFSDPDKLTTVPPGWAAQPINHADWAKGAALAISLDQGVYPALLPAIQRFARERNLDIAVQEGTCGITAGALSRKESDMGGMCCPPGIEDRLPGLRFHTVGIAPIALVVHGTNPVAGVTLDEARLIYRGKHFKWSDFKDEAGKAGPPLPLHPVTRLHCKTRPGHWRLLLDDEDQFGPQLSEVSTIDDMLRSVANDPSALGWEVTWMYTNFKSVPPLKELRVNGFSPFDAKAVARGDYPLYRAYNLTTWEGPQAQPVAAELVAYLMKEVEANGAQFGIVPAKLLRETGWGFRGNEVISEPKP